MSPSRAERWASPVVMVAMPWASVRQPSLQLGILCARLERAGIAARGLYANLEFAERLGLPTYEEYSSFHNFIADWLFSTLLFPGRDGDEHTGRTSTSQFYAFATKQGCSAEQLAEIRRLKDVVPNFIEWVLEAVDWAHVRVVGFSTTMLQPVASLALARLLKERHPHLKVLFGGAGCSGPMGRALHRNFIFVDGVVDGEADLTIAPLVQALLRDEDPTEIPGLLWRDAHGTCTRRPPQPVAELDDYPLPTYQDYFDQLQHRRFAPGIEVRLPFEASRGCWWAVQSHCLFCGLNGEVTRQRARPVEAVVQELKTQREQHQTALFVATDNIIDPRHLVSLPRQLEQRLSGVELFFEVRAVMTRAQMSGLARGGIIHLQPGLESLVPEVLEMVKKGTTPIINLCFLRRTRELGINVYWNMLHGLPGERAEWYEALLSRLPWFFHLTWPDVVEFSLERFSPYFNHPDKHQVHIKGPLPGYRFVWDLPDAEIEELCFDLDFEAPGVARHGPLGARLRAGVAEWARSKAIFTATRLPGEHLQIIDHRPVPNAGRRLLDPLSGLILRTFEEPLTLQRAGKRLLTHHPEAYLRMGGKEGVRRLVEALVREHLLYSEAGQYLFLAIPESEDFWVLHEGKSRPSVQPRARLKGVVGRPRTSDVE
ncbi:RiPP maturation radical SAM C-methyltransferase [Myxococcus stipitatus]|uniref:RiPP maturation radical SAM C-methyltransferase n=1 Tax=Myxococcus stipitatus TaxID=83455 RepID=UPI0030D2B11C